MTSISKRYDLPGLQASSQASRRLKEKLANSITLVASWVEEHDYEGYDPGDGLSSFLRPLAFGNRLAERVFMQLI
jgi:hypothetical protein